MNAKSGHMKHTNESKFYILAMLKHKVEGHVLKSTTLKLNADSSSPQLSNWQLTKHWHSFLSFINCVHYCLVHVFVIDRLFGHRILFERVWSMLHIHPSIQTTLWAWKRKVACWLVTISPKSNQCHATQKSSPSWRIAGVLYSHNSDTESSSF